MAKQGIDEEEIKKEIRNFTERFKTSDTGVKSDEFMDFEKEILPFHFSFYEKACNFCGNIITFKADPKKRAELVEALETCHLNTTPEGVTAFALLFPFAFILVSIMLTFVITTFLMGGEATFFFIIVFLLFGLVSIIPLSTLPTVLANNWRLRASNQMVLSIFYIVSYMRHTSNLELAIKFTSDHLTPPLSLDFKKVIWNLETSKYDSVKESLDSYLDKWKKYNMEYIESMHLIESSLYEPSEKKRIASLEKAMTIILEATYEKMLHYAQALKSPITMLHMLGVILPILGLVILPLVIGFMGNVKWYHISVLYNFFLPVLVWYLGKVILSTRPSGYGQADITEINPELKKYTKMNITLFGKKSYSFNPKWITIAMIVIFVIIGLSPLIIRTINVWQGQYFDVAITKDGITVISDMEKVKTAKFSLLGYKLDKAGKPAGPYGLGSTLLSVMLPFGSALALSFYYKSTTKKLIDIRTRTKELEDEFASALFQLGNRVGDGLPAEMAFYKVSIVTENTHSGKFFELVYNNIATLGMGVEEAIFDKRYGAINKFPSALIESSMKVFVENVKKGPDVASEALLNISTYIKEMHKVEERLKDLMSEITSSMSSQINFLAPLIAGIVIGLTSMITTILNTLSTQVEALSSQAGQATGTAGAGMLEIFGDTIPTFYFQLVVGIYIVQITYLLTGMLNTLENGYDPLNEKYLYGQYFYKSGMLYSFISFTVILLFNIIASLVISSSAVIK